MNSHLPAFSKNKDIFRMGHVKGNLKILLGTCVWLNNTLLLVVWHRLVDILEIIQNLDKNTISHVSRNCSGVQNFVLVHFLKGLKIVCIIPSISAVEGFENRVSSGLHEGHSIELCQGQDPDD